MSPHSFHANINNNAFACYILMSIIIIRHNIVTLCPSHYQSTRRLYITQYKISFTLLNAKFYNDARCFAFETSCANCYEFTLIPSDVVSFNDTASYTLMTFFQQLDVKTFCLEKLLISFLYFVHYVAFNPVVISYGFEKILIY